MWQRHDSELSATPIRVRRRVSVVPRRTVAPDPWPRPQGQVQRRRIGLSLAQGQAAAAVPERVVDGVLAAILDQFAAERGVGETARVSWIMNCVLLNVLTTYCTATPTVT